MRTTVPIKQSDAIKSSCIAGKYFIRKIFKLYGKSGVIKLTKNKLLKIANEFTTYKEKSRSFDITLIPTDRHYSSFFGRLLYNIERKPKSRVNQSGYRGNTISLNVSECESEKRIIDSFWKELRRVAK